MAQQPINRRRDRLDEILREIERRFGPWALYRLSQARPKLGKQAIPTGSLTLDLATGTGGLPRGRITELAGPFSSGKRTIAAHVLANAQAEHGFAAYIDAAHTFDAERLVRCGIDLPDLLLAIPESMIEALTMIELLVRSGGLDAVVLDALPGADYLRPIPPREPLSLLLAQGLRRINAGLRNAPTAVVLVHEQAPQRTDSRALRQAATLRISLRPAVPLRHPSGAVTALRVRAEIVKNKLAPVSPPVTFEIDERVGIRRNAEIVDLALAAGLIEQPGLGLIAGDIPLGRTRTQAIARLADDPALADVLEEQVRAHWLS
jgi:recombination protein RecA